MSSHGTVYAKLYGSKENVISGRRFFIELLYKYLQYTNGDQRKIKFKDDDFETQFRIDCLLGNASNSLIDEMIEFTKTHTVAIISYADYAIDEGYQFVNLITEGNILELYRYSIEEMQADIERDSTFWSRFSWKIKSSYKISFIKLSLLKYTIKEFFKSKKRKDAEIEERNKEFEELFTKAKVS
jgi:hypothetical protein